MLEIPWKTFSEEEIHLILEVFFKCQGYRVYNQHRIQRSVEKGADLILSNPKKVKTAVAAKIRPEKKDIYQMIELSRRKEKRKIYIYCDDPTQDFVQEMSKYKKTIDFWNSKKLTQAFFKETPFYASNLVINNINLMKTLTDIRDIFFMIHTFATKSQRKKKRSIKFKKLSRDSLYLLWRLKDFSVMFHRINKSLQLSFFEKDSMRKISKKTELDMLENYVDLLEDMESSARGFKEFLEEFWIKNKDFLNFVVNETKTRSNWLHLFAFDTISPGNIKRQHKEGKKQEKIQKNFDKLMKKLKIKSEKTESRIIDCLEENSRLLNDFGWAIESTIDDFLSYGFYRKMSEYF